MAFTVPGVTVELDQPVPMRDGTILRADVYRPEAPGTYPVLLIRIPYDKTQSENVIYAHPSWYARSGYIVVCQDTRGRYQSDGEFYPFEYEAEDGYDTVQWCGGLDGSTGKVGMFGASYGGATQLLAAIEGPPALGTTHSLCHRVAILRWLDLQPGSVRARVRALLGAEPGDQRGPEAG